MNNGITVENLLRTFPEALKADKSLYALAVVIAEELAGRISEIDKLRIYARIDELPEDLLDILAYDFKVDWWDFDYSLEEKRKTLKNNWNVHRTLGTKAAVERAISAVYADTKVKEWFEYNGDPYTFKLLIDATYENADPVKHRKVIGLVDFYKNLRSHLDGIEYVVTSFGNCRSRAVVAAAGMGMEITAEVKVYGLG
jgi:phage tail P2-like protein